MFNPNKAKAPPPPPTYAWDEHPEAVMGTIYLYFSSNCDPMQISEERMKAFVAHHQDENGTLTEKIVVTAVQAVRALDGRSGPRPGKTLIALWNARRMARPRARISRTWPRCSPPSSKAIDILPVAGRGGDFRHWGDRGDQQGDGGGRAADQDRGGDAPRDDVSVGEGGDLQPDPERNRDRQWGHLHGDASAQTVSTFVGK
jgi:hypothetical protein